LTKLLCSLGQTIHQTGLHWKAAANRLHYIIRLRLVPERRYRLWVVLQCGKETEFICEEENVFVHGCQCKTVGLKCRSNNVVVIFHPCNWVCRTYILHGFENGSLYADSNAIVSLTGQTSMSTDCWDSRKYPRFTLQ
jgi:hypothetical protein